MTMVHERWNHMVHTDAWSLRNGDPVRYTGGWLHDWPNNQGNQRIVGELKRPGNLWRSSASGHPGGLHLWDAFEDWDIGTPYGIQHDLRLNYLSDLVHDIRKRFVEEASATNVTDFTYIDHTAVPKLVQNPSNLAIKLCNEPQLTTVAIATGNGNTEVLTSTTHRAAMPIVGQGLLSMVTVVATTAGIPTAKQWNGHVPSDTISPGWAADSWRTPVRLQVCENADGVPGAVLGNGSAVMFSVAGLLGPRFYFHRPLVLDNRLRYWLVFDLPTGIVGQSCSLNLSDAPHVEAPYQLKTWNGTAWINHASPSIQFSLHMPKFMWRCKQLWIRADRYKQQVHFRGQLHASRLTRTVGSCSMNFNPPLTNERSLYWLADAKRRSVLAGSENFVFPSIEAMEGSGARARTDVVTNYSDSEIDYAASAWWNFGPHFDLLEFDPEVRPFGYELTGGMGTVGVGLHSLQIKVLAHRRDVRERKLLAWRAGTANCARFEYRTEIGEITSFISVGYFNIGDEFTLPGGLPVGGDRARIRVTAVNNSPGYAGPIVSVELVNRGRYLLLSTPQSGPVTEWSDTFENQDRSITFFLTIRVAEVVVVEGGSGYESDCPVVLDPPVNGIGTFQHARALGRRNNNGRIVSVDLLDKGSGYGDGGRGTSLEKLKNSSDPAENSIWSDVKYFTKGSGITQTTTGYELVGDANADTSVITYNGVTYKAGQSFVGVAGVTNFTLLGGAPIISAGIEPWAHFYFGCPAGAKHEAWTGSWSLLMRATAGEPIGDYELLPIAKRGPSASMRIQSKYKVMTSMANGSDVSLSEVGIGFGWQLPQWGRCLWGIRDVAIFGKPDWDVLLDEEGQSGQRTGSPGSPGPGIPGYSAPGIPVPAGNATIELDISDDGYRENGTGSAVVTVATQAEGQRVWLAEGDAAVVLEAYGEGLSALPLEGEGEGTLELNLLGEASRRLNAEGEATLEVPGYGEGSEPTHSEGEGNAGIELNLLGEASRRFNAEGDAVLELEASGEASRRFNAEGDAAIVLEAYGEGLAANPQEGEGLATVEITPYGEASRRLNAEGESTLTMDAYGEG